jgi:hypothetical protein
MTANWKAEYSQTKRRRSILEDCSNDPFKAARILSIILKQSKETETKRKAYNDLNYFLKLAQRKKAKKARK